MRKSKTRLKNKPDNVLEEVAEKPDFSSQENNVHNGRGIFHAGQYALGLNLNVKKLMTRVIFTQNFPLSR